MNLLKNYEAALQAIYDHVGFREDWFVCPMGTVIPPSPSILDSTEMFWDTDGDTVFYAESKEDLLARDGFYYEDEVFKQRLYEKWIYEGKDFTMIFCDPQTDGMKWFKIFDNANRIRL